MSIICCKNCYGKYWCTCGIEARLGIQAQGGKPCECCKSYMICKMNLKTSNNNKHRKNKEKLQKLVDQKIKPIYMINQSKTRSAYKCVDCYGKEWCVCQKLRKKLFGEEADPECVILTSSENCICCQNIMNVRDLI